MVPAYQRKGVGSRLLQAVESYLSGILDPGWAVSLELIASREAVPFYKKHGFEERPCDWDGPGMFKMLRPSGDFRPQRTPT